MNRTASLDGSRFALATACALALISIGCGDDDGASPDSGPDGSDAGTPDSSTPQPDGGSGSDSVFAVGTLASGPEGSTAYLRLLDDVGLGGAEVSLDEAREFAGQADVAVHEGNLYVASGDEPAITKYTVDQDLELVEETRVSFASYGIESAAFWNNQFVAADKAYMVNGAAELIVWNPETMEIEGTIDLPELEEREGLRVVAGLADRASVVHDGKYYLTLYWTDDSYAQRSDDSVLAVVDVATDELSGSITANCPGLDYATVDGDGMLHFSNWTGGVGTYWVLDTAQNCIATVDPGTEEVTTRTFASIADGHEGAAFKYAGDGRFVMSVFDEVRADVENAEDPFTPVGGTNWQLWYYEPGTGESGPVEDVDWNSGAIIHADVDGGLYSMVPGADYASTVVYALDGEGGASAAFGITGWCFRFFQVR